MEQKQGTASNEIVLLLKEDLIREKVTKRSSDEKRLIKIKRNIALVLNLFVLILGWSLIWLGTVKEQDMMDFFEATTGVKFIGDWSATVIMTFVNYFIPWVLSIVGVLEQWDFSSEEIYANLWKNYYTTMLNIVFFLVLNIQDVYSSVKMEPGSEYECKEDILTDNLLLLFISEIVLRYVFYLYWNIHLKIKSQILDNFDWRTEYQLDDEFVWILTINAIFWTGSIL